MTQIDPFQIGGTTIFCTGLYPLGRIQPAAGKILGLVGNKQEKAHIGAVI